MAVVEIMIRGRRRKWKSKERIPRLFISTMDIACD
jgi:hypothetical protein